MFNITFNEFQSQTFAKLSFKRNSFEEVQWGILLYLRMQQSSTVVFSIAIFDWEQQNEK